MRSPTQQGKWNWKLIVCGIACAASLNCSAAMAQWGDVEGQFVLDGDAPQLADLVKKGDAAVKDASVCSLAGIPDESLVVNSSNKGIANVFVFLRKPDKVHPDLKVSAEKEVVLDQKNCRYIPHALVVRTDQTLVCKSDDNCNHNTHTFPVKNATDNFVLQPNDRKGVAVKMKIQEAEPLSVKCDIHSWMSAKIMVVDHPYAAVTDENGKFTIKNLPVGSHKFRVWHERGGLIDKEWTVDVKAGENKAPTVKLKPDQLKPKK